MLACKGIFAKPSIAQPREKRGGEAQDLLCKACCAYYSLSIRQC